MLRPGFILGVLLLAACAEEAADGSAQDSIETSDAAETSSETIAGETFETDSATVDTAPVDTTVIDTAANDTAVIDSEPDAAADTAVDTVEPDSAVTDSAPIDTSVADTAEPDALATCPVCSARRPIILVHGINGGPENYDVMAARLLADGWPADWIVRFEAADPGWTCNVDNAAAIAQLVEDTRVRTCQQRVDVVAHSMGTLSSRYYVKNLGGSERVNTYVTLGGMHHGLFSPCLAPEFLGVCVWQELCQSGAFIAALNADPATPGALHWVSIYGTADTTVPNESSHLDGAENIVIDGAVHDGANGLLEREDAYAEVKRVLGYDCW